MTRNRGGFLVALVLLGAGLALLQGLAQFSDDSENAPAPSQSSSPESLPDFHGDGDAPTATPPGDVELTWDAREQEKVAAIASQTMRLFARPSASSKQWWAALEPLLSAQARLDYFGIDPVSVPVRRITGPVTLVPMSTELVSIAHIPTDAGLYAVTLSRSAEDPGWVVEQITPPEPDPHTGPGGDPGDPNGTTGDAT